MSSRFAVFGDVVCRTVTAVGWLVEGCVVGGSVASSDDWVLYLPCNVVVRLSSLVVVPPLPGAPSSQVDIATGACSRRGLPCSKRCPR